MNEVQVSRLPLEVPVFPLASVLLLPGALLPLNIFEPRYLAMVEHALAGDRLIGMVHPDPGLGDQHQSPGLMPLGCAGVIEAYERQADGRIALMLTGVSRFALVQELPLHPGGFRRVRADWSNYAGDIAAGDEPDFPMDRDALCGLVAKMLPEGMQLNRAAAGNLSNADLLRALAMQAPLSVWDKQALLESAPGEPRAEALMAALESAVAIRLSAQVSTRRH